LPKIKVASYYYIIQVFSKRCLVDRKSLKNKDKLVMSADANLIIIPEITFSVSKYFPIGKERG
jgi:hypothetical protein